MRTRHLESIRQPTVNPVAKSFGFKMNVNGQGTQCSSGQIRQTSSDFPQDFMVQWPGKILFGAGSLDNIGREANALGRHAFVVTTKDLSKLGLTDRIHSLLEAAGLKITRYEEVQPDPSSLAVDEAAAGARTAGCDLVVAVGGGSAIDLGKAVAVATTHEAPIWDYVTYTGATAKPVTDLTLPIIAVPTTAGTGSEVSQGSVLDNPETGMKAALLSPRLYPRVAVVDPELTYTMPPKVTAMTGFDAFTHGVESFLNAERTNPASELFALEAVRRVAYNLPLVVQNPRDTHARAQMSWAGTCGGLAIALSNASVAHAMALPLGARTGIAHGLALSRLQPVVLAHTWQAQALRCAILADAVGAARPEATVGEQARTFVDWVSRFVEQIGLAKLWNNLEIDESLCAALTDDVFAYMGRPMRQYRPIFTHSEVRQMFIESLIPTQNSD